MSVKYKIAQQPKKPIAVKPADYTVELDSLTKKELKQMNTLLIEQLKSINSKLNFFYWFVVIMWIISPMLQDFLMCIANSLK